jgi:lipopolysaccharide/colanic/teichoic acid biosynthesis glycosyltransferase
MSLVGPRPERPEFMAELSATIPGYLDRLGLKPGLTGLAQVVNGYGNEPEGYRRKVALDLLYLQNCCFRNDAKILLRTVGVVLTGRGAL